MHRPMLNAHRVLLFLGLILLVGLSWWMGESQMMLPLKPGVALQEKPDYHMKQLKLRVMDGKGGLNYLLSAQNLAHFQKGDVTDLEDLQIILYRGEAPFWVAEARRGRLIGERQFLELSGDVYLERLGTDGRGPLEIRVEDMKVNLADETATTDKPVTVIQTGMGRASATGMRMDLVNDRLELQTQVRFVYETQNP